MPLPLKSNSWEAKSTLLILIVSLGAFSTIFGHTLTASVAFPTLNFLNILRSPLTQFPDTLNWVFVEAKISGARISKFLEEGRKADYRVLRPAGGAPGRAGPAAPPRSDRSGQSEPAVEIRRATFRWAEPEAKILWNPADVAAGSASGLRIGPAPTNGASQF